MDSFPAENDHVQNVTPKSSILPFAYDKAASNMSSIQKCKFQSRRKTERQPSQNKRLQHSQLKIIAKQTSMNTKDNLKMDKQNSSKS